MRPSAPVRTGCRVTHPAEQSEFLVELFPVGARQVGDQLPLPFRRCSGGRWAPSQPEPDPGTQGVTLGPALAESPWVMARPTISGCLAASNSGRPGEPAPRLSGRPAQPGGLLGPTGWYLLARFRLWHVTGLAR